MASVSVALAAWNGQRHIRRQLDSIAAQSCIPAELVITDDGSQDDTVGIIEAFAKTAPFPVKLHRNESRLGYRANFMRAAGLCRSELIAFCDQDDYWHRDKIALSMEPFCDPEVLLTYHNALVVDADGRRIGSLATCAASSPMLAPMAAGPWQFAPGFTEVFRRRLLQLSDLWPKSLYQLDGSRPLPHDRWIFFLAAVFGKIGYLHQPLASYVRHGGNASDWQAPGRPELKFYLRDRTEELSRFARAAENRAVILESAAAANLDATWSKRAVAASRCYRKLAWYYTQRHTLYSSVRLADRLRAFRIIRRRGGYAGAWGLGAKSLVTDLCLGLTVAPLMRR
jgi:glycosyltransferase involved in cell wall biosynthesis